MKDTALETFQEKKDLILAQLKTIEKFVKANTHVPLAKINWADVSELGRIEDQLTDICDRINGTGEYAE